MGKIFNDNNLDKSIFCKNQFQKSHNLDFENTCPMIFKYTHQLKNSQAPTVLQ